MRLLGTEVQGRGLGQRGPRWKQAWQENGWTGDGYRESIPDGGRDEQGVPNAETKYYYSIRTATQQPTARPAMMDQREEWLTPATAPVEKKPIGAEEEAHLASA
jgi:hypothetical protein